MDPADYARLLAVCTALLFLRVIGQLIVCFFAPSWLPPMEQWQSGLLPYPLLVVGQAVVLTLMVSISIDFWRGAGFFVVPAPYWGPRIVGFSWIYLGGMVLRYIVRMVRRPDQRWLGGTIPIAFHSVVAIFLWAFGSYHSGGVP